MSKKATIRIALATAAFLLVPLVAMQFTSEVDWALGDFVVAGALLVGAVVSYELVARKRSGRAYRAVIGVAVMALLLLVWVILAVGLP